MVELLLVNCIMSYLEAKILQFGTVSKSLCFQRDVLIQRQSFEIYDQKIHYQSQIRIDFENFKETLKKEKMNQQDVMQDLFPAQARLGELFVSPANMEILGFSDKYNIQVLYTSTIDNLFVIPDCDVIKRIDDENLRVLRQNNIFGRDSLSLECLNSRRR